MDRADEPKRDPFDRHFDSENHTPPSHPRPEHSHSGGTGSDAPTWHLRRAPRVLVIDDQADDLGFVRDILQSAGYEVTCVNEMALARQTLLHGTFSLVVTDLYLGEEGLGYEVALTARAMRPAVPVLLLTAHPSFDNAREALRSQVFAILTKPIDAQGLLANCRRAITETEIRRRNEKLEAQNRVLAQVLPRAIEVKDPTTRGHSDRVVHYADTLARKCGVGEEEREDLRMAALLHDVGKIGIPLEILGKEGPLTASEREVVQRHPAMGFEILEALEDSERVRLWVFQHHERFDGRGYPNGLRGEEVALPGRILILAEVFDALAEARSYKPAWEIERIIGFFRQEAGRHFDPDLAHMVADGLTAEHRRFFASSKDQLF
jgi:putative two-component system response regulator